MQEDWNDKLKIWRMRQQEEGFITSQTDMLDKVKSNAALSVLACL